MGLVNLTTNLADFNYYQAKGYVGGRGNFSAKKLPYGNDRFGNGNSGQPYIQTPIPGQLPRTGTEDFILRGGLNTFEDSATDVLRLGKYFADPRNPDGLLFIAKQNLLSRTAVRTQSSTGILNEGIYTPLSTLVEAGGVAFGLHVNKQGLNPFLGIGEAYTPQRYFDAVRETNFVDTIGDIRNRLIGKYQDLISGSSSDQQNISTYPGGPGSFLGIGQTNIKFATGNDDSPNSARTGINNTNGKEIINGTYLTSREKLTFNRTSDQFTDENDRIKFPVNLSNVYGLKSVEFNNFDYLFQVFGLPEGTDPKLFNNKYQLANEIWQLDGYTVSNITNYSGKPSITFLGRGAIGVNTNASTFADNNAKAYTYNEIINIPTSPSTTGDSFYIGGGDVINGSNGLSGAITTPGDFRKKLRAEGFKGITAAPNYTTKNIEQRVNLGDPGSFVGKNIDSYVNGAEPPDPTKGKSGGNASLTSYDKINVLPIYKSDGPSQAKINGNAITNDLVKFRIGVIDNNQPSLKTYIHFRAFLNQISDGYTANWADTQYIGRGEKFYNYTGFDRKVSLSWTVAAQSKAELIPMYKKLNYLASVCAPDYSKFGYMRGNIVTLTIGGYFYEQPGIITGFNYEMNDNDATWEIGINDGDGETFGNDSSVKELPHLIKVSGFNFIPIHNFVPRLQQNNFGTLNPDNVLIDGNTYGPERYIALENQGDGREPSNTNNYGKFFRA